MHVRSLVAPGDVIFRLLDPPCFWSFEHTGCNVKSHNIVEVPIPALDFRTESDSLTNCRGRTNELRHKD